MPADRDTHHGVYRHSFAKEVLGQRFASSSSSAPARLSTSASEENRGVMTFTTGDCEVQMVALLEASKTGHGYAPAGECSRPPKSTNQSRCNEVQKYLMILGDYARVAKECITTNTSEVRKLIKSFEKVGETHRKCKFCDPYSCKGPKVWEEAKIGCPSEIARHLRIHLCARHQPFHCMFPNCGKAKTQKTNMTSHFGVHKDDISTCEVPWCQRQFACPESLARHHQAEHCEVPQTRHMDEGNGVKGKSKKRTHALSCNAAATSVGHQNSHSESAPVASTEWQCPVQAFAPPPVPSPLSLPPAPTGISYQPPPPPPYSLAPPALSSPHPTANAGDIPGQPYSRKDRHLPLSPPPPQWQPICPEDLDRVFMANAQWRWSRLVFDQAQVRESPVWYPSTPSSVWPGL